jgi:hypothetical protein
LYHQEILGQSLYREGGEFDPRHAAPCRSNPNTRSALSLDQAEACYQLALTEQKLGNIEKTQENFDRAVQLFSEMDASKQVEKVQLAATHKTEKIPN